MLSRWVNTTKRQAAAYLGALNAYRQYTERGHNAVVVTYERLIDPATRVDELSKILAFLGTGWTREDAECAFESPHTKKSYRQQHNNANAATVIDAYPVTLACELWNRWLRYSGPQGNALGVDLTDYTIINNYQCWSESDAPLTQAQLRAISGLRVDGPAGVGTNGRQPHGNVPKPSDSQDAAASQTARSSHSVESVRAAATATTAKAVQLSEPASAITTYQLSYDLNSDASDARATFQKFQNPEDCASAKYLIFRPGGSGFGSQLHIFATQACTAMSLGRILIPLTSIGDPSWLWNDPSFCSQNPGPDCYFERISTCDDYVREHWKPTKENKAKAYDDWSPENQFVYIEGGPWVPEMKPRTEAGVSYCANTFGRSNWKVPLVATMTQPNQRLRTWLEDNINDFLASPMIQQHPSITQWPPHPKMISVAIRWGDKIVDSDLHAISRYINGVKHIINIQHIRDPVVFVTSEDETAVQAFHAAAEGLGWIVLSHEHSRCFQPESHEVYNYSRLQDLSNEHDSHEAIISARGENYQGQYKLFARRGWSNCLSRRNNLNIPGGPPRVAMMSLLNAYLAAEATQTVFTSSSNWGRYIVETKLSRDKQIGVIVDLDAKRHGGQKGSHNRAHLL